jgi:hypothetical protein
MPGSICWGGGGGGDGFGLELSSGINEGLLWICNSCCYKASIQYEFAVIGERVVANWRRRGSMQIELSEWEKETILDDCIASLESIHIGSIEKCGGMCGCPPDHFKAEDDIGEVILRQALIRKLESAA